MTLSNRKWCLGCVEKLKPSLSPEAQGALDRVLQAKSTSVQAAEPDKPEPEEEYKPTPSTTRTRTRTTTPAAALPRPRKSRLPIFAGAIAAVLVMVLVAILLVTSGGARPASDRRNSDAPLPSGMASYSAPESPLPATPATPPPGLEAVRAFAREHPDQVDEILRRYGELLWELTERSPLHPKVKEEMGPFEVKQKEAGARAMREVVRTVELLTNDGKYKQAYDFLEESRARRPDPDWSSEISKQVRELDRAVENAWRKLAEEAQASGDPDKADEILRPSRQWGIDSYVRDGDRIVKLLREKSIPAPPPTDSTAGTAPEILVLPSQMKSIGSLFENGDIAGRKAWTARYDPSLQQASNGLDFKYSVKEGARYNFFFRVYACCAETARFFLQGEGFRGRTTDGRTFDYAIGSGPAFSPPIPASLPKGHEHSGEARQWMWITLRRQNPFSNAGPKRMRLLTRNGGISISHVLVTSTRQNPPTEDELNELEKQSAGGK